MEILAKLNKKLDRCELEAIIYGIGEDILVILVGGKEHIGAVSFSNLSSINFEGHEEIHITQKMAKIISDRTLRHVCVLAGVHLDKISKDEIKSILSSSEDLALEISKLILFSSSPQA